ncbi:hypothetical protein RO955_02795 [Staphylococcus haemolyticus]|uniref:hypothetical protein n=1 Tax=Staphylococcus haemolyticus TaxID=1283 RepID=UPI0028A4A07B|nr:hypothetical protein [Staphylococcus haemolyticus]MDT4239046.1 hypothetical protein [Staphylococcus haemolyticus]MDT4297855.1 hypothetical protein [Staphylococcus haemolyticus]MDT4300239.1 hypothetical protein [Staphylococcus haemolyticus]MDT4312496.1 hypothetical protein [Staphylococcus haemolyticus]MDT4316977.1 hypothetical protein [Staphylococcus haemolyticus]
MAKVKKKVEMTLPELIKWGFKNGIKNKAFVRDRDSVRSQLNFKPIAFNSSGYVEFSNDYSYSPEDTFTVEIEKEIDIYTVLESLYEYTNDNQFKHYKNTPLQIIKDYEDKEFWLKDGGTMTLIWKDGELVGDE